LEENLIQKTAQAISRSNKVVAFTGAGISVESGIPDFRGAGGLWEKFDPGEYATIEAFRADPKKVWAMLKEMGNLLESSRPNAAHLALARLERMGHVRSVITQNIDHLHQEAGNTKVIEYHGSYRKLICLRCGRQYAKEDVPLETLPPLCRCAGVLKPTVVFFGETIPSGAHLEAMEEARNCEVMLVIGTSAGVAPANQMPWVAKRNGAVVVEVNLVSSEITRHLTDVFLQGPAGRVMHQLAEPVVQRLGV